MIGDPKIIIQVIIFLLLVLYVGCENNGMPKKTTNELTMVHADQVNQLIEAINRLTKAKVADSYIVDYQTTSNVIDYQILRARETKLLTAKVKSAMKEGWVPLGGVTGGVTSYRPSLRQTMVKYVNIKQVKYSSESLKKKAAEEFKEMDRELERLIEQY